MRGDHWIQKIDVQILGIGSNGHIGFNEPGTDFDIGVHEVILINILKLVFI